ncbi:hypothetical protein O1611_g10512 [Lasiodiplodia mahajangana]|uniref:Uncharacterized protein n=1 Tax=Lasiodiplodia mahajangana TaxID=1108764 RepID=A0ACC2IXS8_9PEZI|nr:hypothetical protein O1611_g10512 [Lasiodiplodia mahajangana]
MASMEVQLGPTTTNMVDSPTTAANAHYHNPYDLHHHNHHVAQQASVQQNTYYGYTSPTPKMRKRKAESQDNERLSKRLSLLNLEKNGQKLYVPVEAPSLQSVSENSGYNNPIQSSSSSTGSISDSMQLDDTKHKVYIYDLDAELSSADENSESEYSLPGSPTSGRSRLILLPDIQKHLRRSRIPAAVLANKDGELAGHNINDMQMVLYSEPSSLTVPREQDSVRKAILEARARARQKQKDSQAEFEQESRQMNTTIPTAPSAVANLPNFGHANSVDIAMNGFSGRGTTRLPQNSTPWNSNLVVDEDVDMDAMDMD